MSDATGLAEALLGLDGFRVLEVSETPDEVCITVETTVDVIGCQRCGVRALAKQRRRVDIRDLPCFGRPGRLIWLKRRWCCCDPDCEARTWTEGSAHGPSRAVLTRRAGAEATRQVERSPCLSPWWPTSSGCAGGRSWTPWCATPRPSWTTPHASATSAPSASTRRRSSRPRGTTTPSTRTGLVDLDERILIELIEGNGAAELRRWWASQDPLWLETIEVVATDLAESYRRRRRRAPRPHRACRRSLSCRARLLNRCVDKVRRRVQNETLGHRGRKHDPLYRIRKLLLSGSERLDERGHERMLLGLRRGDPRDELLGAWLAKECGCATISRPSASARLAPSCTRRSSGARATRSQRSVPSVTPSSAGRPRS